MFPNEAWYPLYSVFIRVPDLTIHSCMKCNACNIIVLKWSTFNIHIDLPVLNAMPWVKSKIESWIDSKMSHFLCSFLFPSHSQFHLQVLLILSALFHSSIHTLAFSENEYPFISVFVCFLFQFICNFVTKWLRFSPKQ